MAEKPSFAEDIARVLGAVNRKKGYWEGRGYRVTWAVGHLVGLAEPEAYGYVDKMSMWDEEYGPRAYAELPLIPEEFKLIVLDKTREQFEIIEELINDPECDEIINCGDMGPEGHILQWFIREKAGCTKKVRRFCATTNTDEGIRKAMANLRPEEEFANIIKGEFCKKKADWILGMSLSRAESLKYKTGINVGRVMSPTLFFIVKRYMDVQAFKSVDYYGLKTGLAEGFDVFWNKDARNLFPSNVKDSEGRVLDKSVIEQCKNQILQSGKGVVADVKKENKANNRPQLYDITELQRDANRKYGYSAAETLATVQALYETQKVLSYPRTDSRYITDDLAPLMSSRIMAISKMKKYTAVSEKLLSDGLNLDKIIVDNSKVIDHHAIIVTETIEGFDVTSMRPTDAQRKEGVTGEMMRNIVDMVITRMIVSFSKPFLFEQTSVAVSFDNGLIMTATGKKPVQMGWKDVEKQLSAKQDEAEDENAEAEQMFPELQKGQVVTVKSCDVVSKKTTPPKLHTEDTLLSAMENAGAYIENGKIIKDKGIGTPATRAGIIQKLFALKYVVHEGKGKTKYIVPTKKGVQVIQTLPKELYSPKITADWETKIALIADGKMTERQFMDEFTLFINEKVKEVKEIDTGIVFVSKERESVGICPWCGSDLYRWEEKNDKGTSVGISHYCSNKDVCNFTLKTNNPYIMAFTKKKLTETQLKRLIAKGKIVLTCISKKNTEYKGEFTLGTKEYKGKTVVGIEYALRTDSYKSSYGRSSGKRKSK